MKEFWYAWLADAPLAKGTKSTDGNIVDVFVDANEFIDPMIEAMESASEKIAFQFYGMEADEVGSRFGQSLLSCADRGLSIKAILDTFEIFLQTNGKWNFLPWRRDESVSLERKETRRLLREMEDRGIDLFRYDWTKGPFRSHAKLVLCDGIQAFVGGFNPTAHNAKWHDVVARVSGPGALEGEKSFNHFFEASGRDGFPKQEQEFILDSRGTVRVGWIRNDPLKGEFGIRPFLLQAFARAESSIRIECGYLSDPEILMALVASKKRGVPEISIIAPKESNHPWIDSKFRRLIPILRDAGVDVYFYPEMTHAKILLIDDGLVVIGSANLDAFTLRFQTELAMVAVDSLGRLGQKVKENVFEKDLIKCQRV